MNQQHDLTVMKTQESEWAEAKRIARHPPSHENQTINEPQKQHYLNKSLNHSLKRMNRQEENDGHTKSAENASTE